MPFAIPDEIRQQTAKCAHDFGCLSTGRCGNGEMCAVAGSFGPNVLQLAKNDQLSCAYCISFGSGQLCTCPVRCHLHSIGHSGVN